MIRSLIKLVFKSGKKDKKEEKPIDFVWALTGNIVNEHEFGEDKEIRKGSKHFSPGTKVYCIPEFGGMGHERITAIGIPRKSSRYIKVILPSRLIHNWRIKKVYHPHIKNLLIENWYWSDSGSSRKDVSTYVESFNNYSRK